LLICIGALTLRLAGDGDGGALGAAEGVIPARASPPGFATASTLGAAIPSLRCRDATGCEFNAPKILGTALLAAGAGAAGAGSTGDSVMMTFSLEVLAGGTGVGRLATRGVVLGLEIAGTTVTCRGVATCGAGLGGVAV